MSAHTWQFVKGNAVVLAAVVVLRVVVQLLFPGG